MGLHVLRPVGRLAPSPSGALHVGNVCAFGAAWLSTRAAGGRVLLRVEDVDRQRSRDVVADGQRRDLAWLGLDWDEETPRQSVRDYKPWIDLLTEKLYRCRCTRKEAKGNYPGTCRAAGHTTGTWRWRLPPGDVVFVDRLRGVQRACPSDEFGDPLFRRVDGQYTYALANVVDDILDGVSEVVRGADLLNYSAVQVCVWEAFGATPPTWLHAPLIVGTDGRKLSKSHGAVEIRHLRDAGWCAEDVWGLVLPWLGIPDCRDLREAVGRFAAERLEFGPNPWGGLPLVARRMGG